MIIIATPLTAGKLYFIESEAAQQNWLHDPDDIDLDNFAPEGTYYCQIDIPEGFTRNSFSGAVITPSGSGTSFDLRDESRFYRTVARGVQTSLANANLVDNFVMSARHTSGASATFVRYYMIAYFGTNSHLEFTDQGGTPRSYCKGIILSAITQWVPRVDSKNFLLRINWESVWRTGT